VSFYIGIDTYLSGGRSEKSKKKKRKSGSGALAYRGLSDAYYLPHGAARATGRLGRFGPVGSDFFCFSFTVFLFLS
jgi:hypothetical protein